DARTAKARAHIFRCGIGSDIEILGHFTKQQVTHRTADDERGKTRLLQLADNLDCAGTEQFRANAMLGFGVDTWFAYLGFGTLLGKYFVEKFTNHCLWTDYPRTSYWI